MMRQQNEHEEALARYAAHVITGRSVFFSVIGGLALFTWLCTGAYYVVTALGEQSFAQILVRLLVGVILPLAGEAAIGADVWLRIHNTRRLDRHVDLLYIEHQASVELKQEQVEDRRAEREIKKSRFTADDNGNYPIYHDYRVGRFQQFAPGQYKQPVAPVHYSVRNDALPPGKEPQGLLPPSTVSAPTLEECIRQVQRNSLQICVGRSLKTAEYRTALLPGSHILLIGSSQKGKSTQAAAVMEQLTITHDRDHILLALLDMEDQTCNLFANVPHVLRIQLENGRTIKMIARSATEVARYLGLLQQLMEDRYTLAPKERAALPHIVIYIEEFLELKRRLKGEDLAQLADDFTSLATRGLKANMHLMVCAQASYSTEEFREAMGQLVGINMAFCAPPRLAQAAGFWEFDLLKQNFNAKIAGQFVLEATGCTDLCLAPVYQLQAKLQTMQDKEEERASGAHVDISEVQKRPEMQNERRLIALPGGAHAPRTEVALAGAHLDAPAWEDYLDVIDQLQQEGHNQDEIIEKIWHTRKGSGNKKYVAARDIYRQCNVVIKQRRQAAYDRAAGGE